MPNKGICRARNIPNAGIACGPPVRNQPQELIRPTNHRVPTRLGTPMSDMRCHTVAGHKRVRATTIPASSKVGPATIDVPVDISRIRFAPAWEHSRQIMADHCVVRSFTVRAQRLAQSFIECPHEASRSHGGSSLLASFWRTAPRSDSEFVSDYRIGTPHCCAGTTLRVLVLPDAELKTKIIVTERLEYTLCNCFAFRESYRRCAQNVSRM